MAGTGDGKKAILILNSKRVINCIAFDTKFNPNSEGHSDIASDRVLWHSSGRKEWEVNVEVEIEPGTEPFYPSQIDENNPADLVVIDARERYRYAQGVLMEEARSFKEKETMKHSFRLGHFKDQVYE